MAIQGTLPSKPTVLGPLCLIIAFFIIAQIAFFMNNFHPYLKIAMHTQTDFTLPAIVLPQIFYFVLAHMALYAALFAVLWLGTHGLLLAFPRYQSYSTHLALGMSLLTLATILWCNQYFYPSSQYSLLLGSWLPSWVVSLSTYGCLFLLASSVGLALYGWLKKLNTVSTRTKWFIGFSLGGCLLLAFLGHTVKESRQAHTELTLATAPNVILIGIDSLRPDHLQFFGSRWTHTPHLDAFLKRSTTFSTAFTPYGRTFPAWVSILTGLYPPHHGARYNLINPDKITAYRIGLPRLLKQHHYQTLFATDENRFSNIDQRLYFDEVIGPKMGFNDFLLGSANDFPLSNLIINTRLGHWLFPYTYANRAASATYNPNTFLRLLDRRLTTLKLHQPVMLAVHLCLPHWPYLWQQAPSALPKDTPSMQRLYRTAVTGVDEQFRNLLTVLKKHALLNKAWVVLLSDHAEGLALPGDLLLKADHYQPGPHSRKDLTSHLDPHNALRYDLQLAVGHGTNVLSPVQFQPVLAFRGYGVAHAAANVWPEATSLLDIKATLGDLLGIAMHHHDGLSLKTTVLEGLPPQHPRDFYFESALLIDAIKTTHPNLKKVLKEGLDFYRIDPDTGHLVIRDSKEAFILGSKQHAIYRAPWYLARYPIGPKDTLTLLVNTQTQRWTDDLSSAWAQQAPRISLLQALQTMYSHDW